MSLILAKIKTILPAGHMACVETMPFWNQNMGPAAVNAKLETLWRAYSNFVRCHNREQGTMYCIEKIEKPFLEWEARGFIYCICFAPGFYKIGMSAYKNRDVFMKSMYKRYKTAYGFDKLNSSNFICTAVANAAAEEKRVHSELKKYRLGRSEIFANLEWPVIKSSFLFALPI
jgi:hypothetical protein